MKRLSIFFTLLVLIIACCNAAEKLKGVSNVEFGWKYERCQEALAGKDLQKINDRNDETAYTYGPAVWGRIDWDASVLDFYKDKLYQIGFYKSSQSDDKTAFEQSKVILSAAYGQPVKIEGDNSCMWRAANGNIVVLQYSPENKDNGKIYSTYLFFVDNKEVTKKAKRAESELRSIMNGN